LNFDLQVDILVELPIYYYTYSKGGESLTRDPLTPLNEALKFYTFLF